MVFGAGELGADQVIRRLANEPQEMGQCGRIPLRVASGGHRQDLASELTVGDGWELAILGSEALRSGDLIHVFPKPVRPEPDWRIPYVLYVF